MFDDIDLIYINAVSLVELPKYLLGVDCKKYIILYCESNKILNALVDLVVVIYTKNPLLIGKLVCDMLYDLIKNPYIRMNTIIKFNLLSIHVNFKLVARVKLLKRDSRQSANAMYLLLIDIYQDLYNNVLISTQRLGILSEMQSGVVLSSSEYKKLISASADIKLLKDLNIMNKTDVSQVVNSLSVHKRIVYGKWNFQSILIGYWGYRTMRGGKSNNILARPIQIISNSPPLLILALLRLYFSDVNYIESSGDIPSDIRLIKYTFIINLNKIMLVYNSTTYLLIPTIEVLGVLVGHPYVILRFLNFDLFSAIINPSVLLSVKAADIDNITKLIGYFTSYEKPKSDKIEFYGVYQSRATFIKGGDNLFKPYYPMLKK